MVETAKKVKALQDKLDSKNSKVIAETIASLRDDNPFGGAICLLVKYFNTTDDQNIKDLIRNFLNDIKDPESRTEVIFELKEDYSSDTIAMLACSCWQSGLDYADFSSEFADLFIQGDYLTSLECFTVIEESLLNINESNKNKIIRLLVKNIGTFGTEKAALTRTLISILS